ncbi:MAG TPA: TonB-dependent receptor, partial [Thermoanaerobaculia bacterium]|nr:TonB-dependent receptor [Thermoanaerobaculia bacterium]
PGAPAAAAVQEGGPDPAAAVAEEEEAPAPGHTVYATATVREREVGAATAAVTVVGRDAIETGAAHTVLDLLPLLPGVHAATAGTRGGLSTLQLRGGDPNFTLVLLDGVPLNDGTYPVGEVFDVEALPLAAIERVEVVRGPLSSFYGSTGLAGAVNLVTRRGGDGLAGSLAAAGGDAELRRGAATVGGGGGRGDLFLAAAHDEEEGRIAGERFDLDHLQGSAGFAWSDAADLRWSGRVASWDAADYPEGSGGPLLGTGELRASEHEEASLGAELSLGGQRRLQRWTAGASRHRADRASPAIPPAVPASVEATDFSRQRLGWAIAAQTGPGWTLSAGASVERERGENDSRFLLPPELGGEISGAYEVARTSGGAFAELAAARGTATAEIGLRADLVEGGGEELSPRLGLAWRPGGGRTRLRASAGRAFGLPSFFALASPPLLGGNPHLRPEEMVGGDVAVERAFGDAAEVSLGAFVHRFRDLVDFDFAAFTHVNRSRVEAEGIEAAWRWAPAPGWRLSGAATWQEVEDEATGLPLRLRPRWSGGARLAWRPAASPVDLALDARFASSSEDERVAVPGRRQLDGYRLLALAGGWEPARGWRLTARVDNLTDEEHQVQLGFPGPGRAWRLGARWSFGGGGEAGGEAAP